MNPINLNNIYITLYPQTTEFTFFSSARDTFKKIDYMLNQKASLNNFQEIIENMSLYHNKNKIEFKTKNLEYLQVKQCTLVAQSTTLKFVGCT